MAEPIDDWSVIDEYWIGEAPGAKDPSETLQLLERLIRSGFVVTWYEEREINAIMVHVERGEQSATGSDASPSIALREAVYLLRP